MQLVAENLFPPEPTAAESADATATADEAMPAVRPGAADDADASDAAKPSDVGLDDDISVDAQAAVNGGVSDATAPAPTSEEVLPAEPSAVVGSVHVQAAGSEYQSPGAEEAPAATENGGAAHSASGEANGAPNGGAPRRVVVVLRRSPDLGHDIDLLRRLDEAAAAHPGDVPLDLHIEAPDGALTRLRWRTSVSASPELVAHVVREYDAENVVVERASSDST